MERHYHVSIMTNKGDTVLYAGVTNELARRVYEHKEKLMNGITSRYKINKLVYYEVFSDPIEAIAREKQLKGESRKRMADLIESINPMWKALFHEVW